MQREEAARIFAAITAAHPRMRLTPAQATFWVSNFAQLQDAARLAEAVRLVLNDDEYFPTIARIRKTYLLLAEKFGQPALPEPPLTEQEREENLRQARALTERLSKGLDASRGGR